MAITADCPSCRSQLRVADNLAGKMVRCPKCKNTFRIEVPAEEEGPFEVVEDEAPRPKKARATARSDDYEDAYDEDRDDRPKRGGNRRKAEASVKVPAILMMVAGGIGVVLTLLAVVNAVVGGPAVGLVPPGQQNQAQQQLQQQLQQFQQMSNSPTAKLIGVVLNAVWSIITVYGGYKLMRLENFSSVLIGVIFMMLPCNCGCCMGLPVGIWALIVLLSDNVKRSFK